MDANKLKLVEYLALPKACRPMPLKRFAAEILGVSEPTVHSWKKDRNVILSIRKTIESRFADDIPDVLVALRNSAIAGNPRAAKLFLEYVDGGHFKVEISQEKEAPSNKEALAEIENLTQKYYPKTK